MSEYLSKSLLSTYHIITNITTTLIQTWDLQHRWLACLGSAVLSVIHQLTRSLMCVNRLQERHNHLRLHLVVILSSHGGIWQNVNLVEPYLSHSCLTLRRSMITLPCMLHMVRFIGLMTSDTNVFPCCFHMFDVVQMINIYPSLSMQSSCYTPANTYGCENIVAMFKWCWIVYNV